MVKISLAQKMDRRVYLLVNDASGNRIPEHEYDKASKVHTIGVRAPTKDATVKIQIFWSTKKFGTFKHLIDYTIKPKANTILPKA